MTGDLVEHVIEKRHAGLKLASAATIQIDEDMNLSFQGIPLYLSRALRHFGKVHRIVGRSIPFHYDHGS